MRNNVIFSPLQCCQTGPLNTDDDNWERGEVNFFVGRQLGACENFPINWARIEATLMHRGNDGGRVHHRERSDAYPVHDARQTCFINVKLDGTSDMRVNCTMEQGNGGARRCNGGHSFCDLR